MLLKNLISNLKPEVAALKIKGISFDSRDVKKNDTFFAIKGNKISGIKFVGDATVSYTHLTLPTICSV